MWVYEENFRLLYRLLPDLDAGDFFAMRADGEERDVDIEVAERSKYTTTLVLRKFFGSPVCMPDLEMKVRVYFDAGVAEVLSYQDCQRLPARYQISGNEKARYRKDEKQQINKLLNELLRYCIRRGFQPARSRCTSV